MNLVKWFRKNRGKIMAVVVVVLMLGFIGGGAFTYLLSPKRASGQQAIAYFAGNKKITNIDVIWARQELEILRMLRMDDLLRSQDLRGVLMAELLFSEGRAPAALINQIRQAIRASRYSISDKQITDIYSRSMPTHIYWLLLTNEAQLAGIRIPNNEVGQLLGDVIPQLFKGQTYAQRVGQLLNQYRLPEARILAAVGKLLAVLQYAQLICATCDVTSSQIKHIASFENETINVEFVKFDSAVFAKTEGSGGPSEEQMLEHFNKYKEFFNGDVSEENPYGFGYKLPDRVQLEYIVVKLDEISTIVPPPTHQEMEEFYRKHTKQFTESIPKDPNDPNSSLVERTRSYAEVTGDISKQLLQDKINSKVESILQEARTLTEAGLDEGRRMRDEGRETKEEGRETGDERRATDYETIAKQLAQKHKIKVYTGQTGLLNTADFGADKYLRRLYVLSQERSPVQLSQIVFSIPDQGSGVGSEPRTPNSEPQNYENIGPVRDYSAEIMALVRVIKAEKASAPESIDSILDTRTLMLDDKRESSIEHPVSKTVKEKVADDLKKLAVFQQGLTKSKAEEFVILVAKEDWDKAIDKFNELYGQPPKLDTQNSKLKTEGSDPNVFRLERLTNIRRISGETLAIFAVQSQDSLAESLFVREVQKRLSLNEAKIQSRFIDQLYSLVPQDSNSVSSLPILMEFKPYMSFYVIKNISVKHLGLEEYEKIKARRAFTEDQIQSESMAPVHFSPENILKRMNFRLANQPVPSRVEGEEKAAESATADESEGAS